MIIKKEKCLDTFDVFYCGLKQFNHAFWNNDVKQLHFQTSANGLKNFFNIDGLIIK